MIAIVLSHIMRALIPVEQPELLPAHSVGHDQLPSGSAELETGAVIQRVGLIQEGRMDAGGDGSDVSEGADADLSPLPVSSDDPWRIVESGDGRVVIQAFPEELGFADLKRASPQRNIMHETQDLIGVEVAWPHQIGTGQPGYRHLIGSPEMIEAAMARGLYRREGLRLPYLGDSEGLGVFALAAPRILSTDYSIQCLFFGGEIAEDGQLFLRGSLPYILCQISKIEQDYQISFRVPGYMHPQLGEFIADVETRAAELIAVYRETE